VGAGHPFRIIAHFIAAEREPKSDSRANLAAVNLVTARPRRAPWEKGKLRGARRQLRNPLKGNGGGQSDLKLIEQAHQAIDDCRKATNKRPDRPPFSVVAAP